MHSRLHLIIAGFLICFYANNIFADVEKKDITGVAITMVWHDNSNSLFYILQVRSYDNTLGSFFVDYEIRDLEVFQTIEDGQGRIDARVVHGSFESGYRVSLDTSQFSTSRILTGNGGLIDLEIEVNNNSTPINRFIGIQSSDTDEYTSRFHGSSASGRCFANGTFFTHDINNVACTLQKRDGSEIVRWKN